MSSANISTNHLCSICDKTFNCSSNLRRHSKQFHPERFLQSISKESRLMCGLCDTKCSTMIHLCDHLRSDHNLNMIVEEFNFTTKEQLQQFFVDSEKTRKCKFVKKSCTATMDVYYCNRSGKTIFKPENDKMMNVNFCCRHLYMYNKNTKILDRKRAPRISRINRIGFYCSAFAYVKKISTVETHVKACLMHYGHDSEIRHARISQSLRSDIVNHIGNERSVDWIINHCEYKIITMKFAVILFKPIYR